MLINSHREIHAKIRVGQAQQVLTLLTSDLNISGHQILLLMTHKNPLHAERSLLFSDYFFNRLAKLRKIKLKNPNDPPPQEGAGVDGVVDGQW